jgi:hypothetical protein
MTESTPFCSFDAHLSKKISADGKFSAWRFTIKMSDFPFVKLADGDEFINWLNVDTYKESFEPYYKMFASVGITTIPEEFYSYTVERHGDEITISGLSETTVRVAIVNIVRNADSNTKVMMVRPPINFRVHKTKHNEEPVIENVGFAGFFDQSDSGDY